MVNWLVFFLITFSLKSINNKYTEDAPIIDGKISEECWNNANILCEFVQLTPQKGESPTESTKVYLLHDNKNLYFGMKCFDDPGKIKANTRIRESDRIAWDDGIGIFISPDKNKMDGYLFQLNAVGTQKDVRLSEGGNSSFAEWDGEWSGKTTFSDDGWEAEIVIPFRILEYNNADTNWGFNVIRFIARKLEVISWCNISDQGRIKEWGEMRGLKLKRVSEAQKLINYNFSPFGGVFLRKQQKNINLGVDALKINLNSKFKSEFTLFPDYAHIEADVDEFNLDKLPQWLPEKRPFFIEDLGMFDTPITLLYTRSITGILTGAKAIVHLPGIDCGFLGAILDTTPKEMTLAGRVKKSTKWFNLGFLGINNINPENKVFNFDASFNLPKQIFLSGQVAKSWTESNGSDILYYLLFKRTVDTGLNLTAYYKYIPLNFKDIRGYIPMIDLITSQIGISPKFQLNRWIIRDFSLNSGYLLWQTTFYEKIKESIWGGMNFTFLRNIMGSFSYTNEVRIYNSEHYYNKLWTLTTSYMPGGMSGVGLNLVYGDYWGGKLIYPSLNFNYTLYKIFTNSLILNYQILNYPDGTADSALILVYIPSLTPFENLNLRSFIQRSDKSNIFMTNILLDWTIFKRSKLYIALNRTKDINTKEVSWIFFTKINSSIWF
ncbi:MAG: carbohydrate binding family 9 domain-containing protein [candidate division WOR-3 bacterium]